MLKLKEIRRYRDTSRVGRVPAGEKEALRGWGSSSELLQKVSSCRAYLGESESFCDFMPRNSQADYSECSTMKSWGFVDRNGKDGFMAASL